MENGFLLRRRTFLSLLFRILVPHTHTRSLTIELELNRERLLVVPVVCLNLN
jgi:hypothetical protein